MSRLLIFAILGVIGCKLLTGRWPWQFLSYASTRNKALTRARRLLAVPTRATREEIIGAHRRLTGMVHPDRGGTNEQVHEANAGRDILLDEIPDQI